MKAHASTRDWVEIDSGCHYILPSAGAILETLGTDLNVFGIAAIYEGGQIDLRAGAACQAPNNPSNSCQCIWVTEAPLP
jgi:hypothetical protein